MSQQELKYKITIEPTLFGVFEEMAADMPRFGISNDDFLRAIWTWSAEVLSTRYPGAPPDWLVALAEEKARKAGPANIIEGEATG
jgi:hypothetical protein